MLFVTDDGSIAYTDLCQVSDEFSYYNYKSSPDGSYRFKLLNDATTLDFDVVSGLKIELDGSYIPIQTGQQELPNTVF